jgi:HAD superfamily hydrolase (TIGR01509 family)
MRDERSAAATPRGPVQQATCSKHGAADRLQAVLFDMDGTLCETEPAWMAAEHAMAQRYGSTWTHKDGLALVGNNLIDSGIYIKERMNLPQPAAEVVEELVDEVVAVMGEQDVAWRPGAIELLAACNDADLPTALVTMSYDRFADAVVKVLPAGRFDAVVTGESVVRGKPAPDAYLRAAALLGVSPAEAVAIEDSPTGAASAEAAGCVVVVVPNHVDVPTSPGRVFVPTLSGLGPADLESLFSRQIGRPPAPGTVIVS